jgi:WD40 repeat protein
VARLWDGRSGERINELLIDELQIQCVAFSPDSTVAAAGGTDNIVRLWDCDSGKPISRPLGHRENVNGLAFSPDGRTVVTGSSDGTARLWDAHSGTALGKPMVHESKVEAVAYNPDGVTLATASDGVVRLWFAPQLIPENLLELAAASRGRTRVSEAGRLESLPDDEYVNSWKKLETDGADWLAEQLTFDERRTLGWHRYEAAEAEDHSDWFAAEFHLQWLLKSVPDDVDLKRRHEHAKEQLAAGRR